MPLLEGKTMKTKIPTEQKKINSKMSMGTGVPVGLVQLSAAENSDKTVEKTVRAIEKLAQDGAKIVCLQELYATHYFPQIESAKEFKLAESIPGPSTERFSALAKKHKIVIIAPLFEKRAAGLYHNTVVVIDADGSLLGKYRKMHIPDDPGFYEKFYFTPGDLGFRTFATRYAKIGVLICWDQWFPEAARLTALSGAQILFYPTAIGVHTHEPAEVGQVQRNAWETIQRSHAIANGTYVVCANRVGQEGDIYFWGSSFVSGPFGEILAQADDEEACIMTACDLTKLDEVRENWPFWRDRRIDAYGPLSQRFLDESLDD